VYVKSQTYSACKAVDVCEKCTSSTSPLRTLKAARFLGAPWVLQLCLCLWKHTDVRVVANANRKGNP
jgi:hypothetical protein